MQVRELERLLVEHGARVSKLDTLIRRLRELGRLPDQAGDPNDLHINSREAAAILLALAGSTKGPEADLRLKKLEALPRAARKIRSPALLGALAQLLEQPQSLSRLQEVRVRRTGGHAAFIFVDGRAEEFRATKQGRPKGEGFRVEGVLPAALLSKVAHALTGGTTVEDSDPNSP